MTDGTSDTSARTGTSAATARKILSPGALSPNIWRAMGLIPLWERFAVLGGLLFASLFELVGLSIVVPLFAMVLTSTTRGGTRGAIKEFVAEALGAIGYSLTFMNLFIVVMALLAIKATVTVLIMRHVGDLMARITTEARLRLMSGFLNARWSYLVRNRMSRIVSAVSVGVNRIGECFQLQASIFAAVFQVLVYFGLCVAISPPIAGLGALVGLVMVAMYGGIRRSAKSAARQYGKEERMMSADFADKLPNMKAIKAMGRQAHFSTLFAHNAWKMHLATRRRVFWNGFASEAQEPIIALTLGMGLYFSNVVLGLDLSHQLIIVMVLIRLVTKLKEIQRTTLSLTRLSKSYAGIIKLINGIEVSEEQMGGSAAPDPRKGIEFRDVMFRYARNKKILAGADFTIPSGRLSALVGPSGTGKTTILDLMLGLLRPNSGEILLGGQALDEVDLRQWRRMIGYVPQETTLFHDSVYNNITLGDPSYDRQTVIDVLRSVDALDFVMALPQQLDHVVGERGAFLSGGQRQRIAIARALLARPSILILDEATAGLDRPAERGICALAKSLSEKEGLTVIAVSHSPEWLPVADEIFEIKEASVRSVDRLSNIEPQPAHGASA